MFSNAVFRNHYNSSAYQDFSIPAAERATQNGFCFLCLISKVLIVSAKRAKQNALRSTVKTGRSRAERTATLLTKKINELLCYVYLIQSLTHPKQRYIGKTTNLKKRLKEHNQGKSSHTSKYLPWEIITAIAFKEERTAADFEKYLKHGSGHAFAKRHFWTNEKK